jgi:DNA-binding NarL/FixJ family response regulator
MIRSGTVNSIHELAAQGKSIHAITVELGLARNTVRKYATRAHHRSSLVLAASEARSSIHSKSRSKSG